MHEDRIKDTHKLISETVAITVKGLMLSTEAEGNPAFRTDSVLKELQLNLSIIEEQALRDIAVLLIGEKTIDFMRQSNEFAVVSPEDVEGLQKLLDSIKGSRGADPEAPTG